MPAVVKAIIPNSPASDTTIKPGDIIYKINGSIINDILDYMFYCVESRLILEVTDSEGKTKIVEIDKDEGDDVGIEFESSLLDEQQSCRNNCIFCFIDQLPSGMRETLYYKDDDLRLSFFQGNYITLSNLSRYDIRRIIKMRISPINISIHTMNPKLRSDMLRNKNGALGVKKLIALVNGGIKLNLQIVCCPGINDGASLMRTMKSLSRLTPAVNSVSIVPVGLTKHRTNLFPLSAFDKELAEKTIKQVEVIAKKCYKKHGKRVFYCSDELYILAGMKLPSNKYYEDYPQLENGVGMMRLFATEFIESVRNTDFSNIESIEPFSVITGKLAAKYIETLLIMLKKCYDGIDYNVYSIRNDFFGDSITVSGLITGQDIVAQVKGRKLGSRLLIPENMLRAGDNVFLDDMTVDELSNALNVPICIVKQNGADFLYSIITHQNR